MGRVGTVPEIAWEAEDVDWKPQRDRNRSAREKRIEDLSTRPFVCWDGEGADNAIRKAQNYVLFGSYNGTEHDYITGKSLSVRRCLELIIKTGLQNPRAWHVSFAFGYDVNMILKGLSPKQFAYLKAHRKMLIFDRYRIEHIPGKWFQVTDRAQLPKPFTVRIYDVFGFYQSSFLSAIKRNIADHPAMANLEIVESGKAGRHSFTFAEIGKITAYWKVEQILFHALISRLREMCYSAGLYIAKWHGPGELASYLYRTHHIKDHKRATESFLYHLSRLAYAGGRFERFHVGRYTKVYGLDINSAYPDAISRLPSLQNGRWYYQLGNRTIQEFGLYKVELRGKERQLPGPLFRRDRRGNITFPWELSGWYWGPEVMVMVKHYPELRDCVKEAWVYEDDGSRPFAFVRDIYSQRQLWKSVGNGAEMALKLALNSLYGKMAQRAGWERNGKQPAWHQLEWAGWVTSYTRAKLYDIIARIPWQRLIAVETDGIYTTEPPENLDIENSADLGGWEIVEYDEIIYLQSGVYAKCKDGEWELKYRGLDKDSLTAEDFIKHAKRLFAQHPAMVRGYRNPAAPKTKAEISKAGRKWLETGERMPRSRIGGRFVPWPKIQGMTTRFIGYENALFREKQNRGPFANHHCVWETTPMEIDCGKGSKRIHSINTCNACNTSAATAYEIPHDTVIQNKTAFLVPGAGLEHDILSYPHDIPWLDLDDPEVAYEWRLFEQELEGLIHE